MEALAPSMASLFSPSSSPSSSSSTCIFSPRTIPCSPLNNRRRVRPSFSIVAAMSKSVKQSRKTLSSNWDLSEKLRRSPSSLPSFNQLDTTEMLLQQRIVFLGSQVETMTADLVITQLLLLDAKDPTKDIKLFINSPGGSVTDGMAIYDAMKLCKADISTVCVGLAASVATFLLASGTKGKRFSMPNSRIMIQQPYGTVGGSIPDLGIQVREMMYQRTKLLKILSRITGKPEDQLDNDTDKENFMNPWEAKEYGLVDSIIDDGKPGLVAPVPDPTPPPKTPIWHFWTVGDSGKSSENLPSEEKLVQNGKINTQ